MVRSRNVFENSLFLCSFLRGWVEDGVRNKSSRVSTTTCVMGHNLGILLLADRQTKRTKRFVRTRTYDMFMNKKIHEVDPESKADDGPQKVRVLETQEMSSFVLCYFAHMQTLLFVFSTPFLPLLSCLDHFPHHVSRAQAQEKRRTTKSSPSSSHFVGSAPPQAQTAKRILSALFVKTRWGNNSNRFS